MIYLLLLLGIEWLATGVAPLPEKRDAASEPVAGIVFYTDEEGARNARILSAIEAFREGSVSLIVMTGGDRPRRGEGYNGARNMRSQAISLGVPETQVIADRGSNDSVSNLLSAVDSLRGQFNKPFSLVLFSDRLHLLRLSLIVKTTALKDPMIKQSIRFVDTGGLPTGFARWRRLNHELAAYLSLFLPDALSRGILAQTRQS